MYFEIFAVKGQLISGEGKLNQCVTRRPAPEITGQIISLADTIFHSSKLITGKG